jgi:aspartate aminotransferase
MGMIHPVTLSAFAKSLHAETAFDVLAIAKALKAKGKEVVELQIGDSPFTTPAVARSAGIRAIESHQTHYCSSLGLPDFREAIAKSYREEFGVPVTAQNVVVGPGAKLFEQFFCEAFLDPGDEVLVFSPHFPTYGPNIERRGARMVSSQLRQEHHFRPDLDDVELFLRTSSKARAIFLNSPHNPTGGVATAQDLHDLADLIRGKNIAVFSDEPYCHMVWEGKHGTLLSEPGMLEQVVAVYTFSKSYSMSGWRLGYAVTSPRLVEAFGKMINTSISCVSPVAQWAGKSALEEAGDDRIETMRQFHQKVKLLVDELRLMSEVEVLMPAGTFYVFPDVSKICRRLGITSHGLAMFLLEGADGGFGVACLGGECFGPAGRGFLRFSCAEPDERLIQAVKFFAEAITRTDRVEGYLASHPQYRLKSA